MVRVERVRYNTGSGTAVLDLQVSTASELPALASTIGSMIVDAGSIAQVIQSGTFYTLDDDGKWYNTDGSAVI